VSHLCVITDIGVHRCYIGLLAEFVVRFSSLDCAHVVAAERRVCNFDTVESLFRSVCPVLAVQTEYIHARV